MEEKIKEIYNKGFYSFQKLYQKIKEPSRQLIRKENKRILTREGIKTQNIIKQPRISTRSTRLNPDVILPIGKRKN